jgi:hypothetical protein
MTYTVDLAHRIGNGLQMRAGTFTDAHDTGDSIVTGLNKVLVCGANANITAKAIGIKESSTAGTLTIYGETSADTDDGIWFAIGK